LKPLYIGEFAGEVSLGPNSNSDVLELNINRVALFHIEEEQGRCQELELDVWFFRIWTWAVSFNPSLLIIRILTIYVYGIQRHLHGSPFLVLRLLGLEAVFRLDRCGRRGGVVVELEFTLLRRCYGILLLLYINHHTAMRGRAASITIGSSGLDLTKGDWRMRTMF